MNHTGHLSALRFRLSTRSATLALAAGAAVLIAEPASAAPCTLNQAASLPASFKNGGIIVDVRLNGTTAKFSLDTGWSSSRISPALAQRLNLPLVDLHMSVSTRAGTTRPDGVTISELAIGQVVAHNTRLVATYEGGDGTTDEPAGEITQDLLGGFDVEIDPALNRVNLFAPIQCPEGAAYWSNDHFELPISTDEHRKAIAKISIDGKELDAVIAAGEAHSSIDFGVAKDKLGLPEDVEAPLPSLVGNGVVQQAPAPSHTFDQLIFGPITVRHPQLRLRRSRALALNTGTHIKKVVNDDNPVIIGMDVLGKFHSMISLGMGRIYFTLPNERTAAAGGPSKP